MPLIGNTGRRPPDRNFGFVFAAAFLLAGLWPLRHGQSARLWFLGLSAALLLTALLRPSFLAIPNLIWTRCGVLMGKIVNPIVLGILFFLVITPVALILRLMRKDLLLLSFDRDAETYWIPRSHGESSAMVDQF